LEDISEKNDRISPALTARELLPANPTSDGHNGKTEHLRGFTLRHVVGQADDALVPKSNSVTDGYHYLDGITQWRWFWLPHGLSCLLLGIAWPTGQALIV